MPHVASVSPTSKLKKMKELLYCIVSIVFIFCTDKLLGWETVAGTSFQFPNLGQVAGDPVDVSRLKCKERILYFESDLSAL